MSYDLSIHTKRLVQTDLLPKIQARFRDFDMDVEFYPDIELNTETRGFFPVKLKVYNTTISEYNDKELISGFEIYINKFNPQEIQEDQKIKTDLEDSIQTVQLSTSEADNTEFRTAMFFALALAELTEGIVENPQEGTYFTPKEAAAKFPDQVKEYEEQIPQANFTTHPFERWP